MLKIIVNNIENQSDKKKAFEIRDIVFCKEQKVSKKIEFDGLDEFCDHYLAKINELPIGTARIREEKKGIFKIERMAVLKDVNIKNISDERKNILAINRNYIYNIKFNFTYIY